MIEVFDYNEILSSSNLTLLENRQTINRKLIAKISKLSFLYNFNKIKTNIQIISILEDSSGYIVNPIQIINNITSNLHYYGKLMGIDVYLDNEMQWDDNKIIPIYDPILIRSYKINKIKGNNPNVNILNYLEVKNINDL